MDSEATDGVPSWGSGGGKSGASNRLPGRMSDGRDMRISKKRDSRGHGKSECGPSKDRYTGFLAAEEDHLLHSHCQVESRSVIGDSEVMYYLAPFSRSSFTTASCPCSAASESGV